MTFDLVPFTCYIAAGHANQLRLRVEEHIGRAMSGRQAPPQRKSYLERAQFKATIN